jgi:hypothetical protein
MAPIGAQQPASDRPGPPAELLKALTTLSEEEPQVFSATIKDKGSDQPEAGRLGNAIAIVQVNGMGSSTEFRGEAEVLLKSNRRIFLLSKERLPEVQVFDNGERTLVRTTTEGEILDAKTPVQQLACFLDRDMLTKQAREAKAIEVKKTKSGTSFTFPLSPRVLRKTSGGGIHQMAALALGGEVVGVQAVVQTNAEGKLTELQFSVTSTDVSAAMRKQVESGIKDRVAGGDAVVEKKTIKPEDLAKLAKEDSSARKTLIYSLRASAKAPSERMQTWVNQAEKLTGD